jgi:Cupin-like domain
VFANVRQCVLLKASTAQRFVNSVHPYMRVLNRHQMTAFNTLAIGGATATIPRITNVITCISPFHTIQEDDASSCSGTATATDDDVAVNAWLGPANTSSPCHTDPTHNLLCQVSAAQY